MNNFKKYDVVVFDEHNKIVVLASTMLDGIEYLYTCGITDDEQDLTNEYSVMKVNCSNASLGSVEDKELLSILLPKFYNMLREDEE